VSGAQQRERVKKPGYQTCECRDAPTEEWRVYTIQSTSKVGSFLLYKQACMLNIARRECVLCVVHPLSSINAMIHSSPMC